MADEQKHYTVFVGERLVSSGTARELLPALKARFESDPGTLFLIFEDETGRQVDFDLRGSVEEVLARHAGPSAHSGPGRPKLGVVPREVTLLPRHWEWLETQSGGASGAIRRLIDEARKREPEKARRQQAIQAAGRFLTAMAGNYPQYEEASRALYANDGEKFETLIAEWPSDVRRHASELAKAGFSAE